METPKIQVKRVIGRAEKQLEGLGKRPDLVAGLPFPPDKLEGALGGLKELQTRHERARAALAALTKLVQDAAFGVRDSVGRNIRSAQTRFGEYARELVYFGAKPRKGTHRPPAADAPASAAPSAATDAR